MIGIDRLGEEVERAFLHRRDRVLDAAERRHDDDRQLGIELLRRAQHAEAVAFGQPQVGQHDRGSAGVQRGFGFGLIARLDDGVALRLERMAQHRAQRVLVLDEQNGGWRLAAHGWTRGRRAHRSQPGGTPARRASSSRSATAFLSVDDGFLQAGRARRALSAGRAR